MTGRGRTAAAACAAALSAPAVAGRVLDGGASESGGETSSTSDSTVQAGLRIELTFAIAGMVTPENGFAYYWDLSRYVSRKVGLPVRLFHKAEYAQFNDILERRKVGIAFVCSDPYVAGHDKFRLELLAAPVVNGKPVCCSYVIVPKDSPVTQLEGLRGKMFAFTDPGSNTGRAMPTYLVAKMGIDRFVVVKDSDYDSIRRMNEWVSENQ